jgi:predicted ATPase/DNA-binding winged helix-turn-helix (wHTH) protein
VQVSFGPYRLFAAQRLLLEGDKPVRLGGRAFDILIALIERAGQIVSKEELIARVWSATRVEEANLKIQISALRRALGDGQGDNRYVATVIGRGYNFVAPIRLEEASHTPPSRTVTQPAPSNLPIATTRMIGREDLAATLVAQLARQRLVTVVGPGGIGKTTLALAVADRMIGAWPNGVWMVDLAPLSDPGLLPGAVAAALGLEVHAEDPLTGLVAAIQGRRMLLLLDNCEHVVDAAAGLAMALLRGVTGVTILATSREPLGIQGEHVQRVGPLKSPEPSSGLTVADVAASPAVQLFIERVAAIDEGFVLTEANAPLVASICRRLDGLPLAIEFAAPRVEVLGIEGLATGLAVWLDDSLRLLGTQRRAAIPRHRTIQAVVDWSYGLLGPDEQRVFCSLGIFAGGFTVRAAAAVAMDSVAADADAIARLADLVAKSLVVVDVSGADPRFRLLGTIRAFALEKLQSNGEHEAIAHRHAEHYRGLFVRSEGEALARSAGGWLADAAREIDNVRAALDWSLSSPDHAAIGLELTAACVPVWMSMSLATECRERCEHALRLLESAPIPDMRLQMRLRIGLGNSLLHTLGPAERARGALNEALSVADHLGDLHAQLRILLVLSSANVFRGDYARAAVEVGRAAEIAYKIGDLPSVVVAERRMGTTLLTIGRLNEARQWLERAIRSPLHEKGHPQARRYSRDRALARAMLSRVLWLRGFPDAAQREAKAAMEDVQDTDHQLTMCQVLYFGLGRIAPLIGAFDVAESAISSLIELATRANALFWITAGQFLRGKLLVHRHAYAEGLAVLREACDVCHQTGWRLSYPEFAGSVALALAGLGRPDEAHDAIIDSIESAGGRTDGQQWYVPELLRIKGEILLARGSESAEAERCLDQAAAMAREQGALSWELRIALSRHRVRARQGRDDERRQGLAAIHDRFTEGFDTADLITAKQLLGPPGNAAHD